MPDQASLQSLPKVVLTNVDISEKVLSFIPLATVEKFQVTAFYEDEKILKLAIVHPEALKQGFYTALKDLGQKIGKEIVLHQTDSASLQSAIRQYKKEGKEQKEETSNRKPPLFELGKTVSSNYLKKIPLSFSLAHRIACVDYLPPNRYWFVVDKKNSESSKKTLSSIEKSNNILTESIAIDKKDLDDLIEYYQSVERAPQENWEDFTKEEATENTKKDLDPLSPEDNKEMVTPQAQGAILSSEEEKPGIAGLFQKVAQNLSNDKSSDMVLGPEPVKVITIEPIAQQPIPEGLPSKQASANNDQDLGKILSKPVETVDELRSNLRAGFVPQIVAAMVSFAIHEKASDIHLEGFDDEVRVRFRIDGQLMDIVKLPADIHASIVSRIKILGKLRLDETRVPQDGRFDVNFENAQVDVRVSVMPTVHGEKVVLRILDKSKGISSLESLGIEGLAYQNIVSAINKPYGICLATGPTGSGKSTSLYAILNRIATPNVNVVTLEDPVEYEIKGINQSQIRPKIGYTFADGLRSILRQDPNIIMVGEIRDGETATMATQAALTGHLVLSSLHTNDAAGAIPRLLNMGIEPFLVTSSLNVVMAQRLVRKICPHCRAEVSLPSGVVEKITKEMDLITKLNPLDAKRVKEPFTFYQGTGCEKCGGKGYLGRVGIYEAVVMTDAIEELTLARASATAIQEQAQKEGMITMYQDGFLKVISGITTLDEVLRETSNK